jgi:phytoene desaturase (3,4-didehydrolycopene-forming)
MYMGMSPFHAPATYSLLQYAEYAKGVWYPIGGFATVPQAFEKIASTKHGVKFRYDTPVKKVLPDIRNGGRIESVELESGEEIKADLVVCNADLIWAYNKCVAQQTPRGKPSSLTSLSLQPFTAE